MKLKGIENDGIKRIAQTIFEDEWEEDPDFSGMTLVLEDAEDIDGFVNAFISHPLAGDFAEFDQSIEGSYWEADGSNFAYASFPNSPGLIEKLEKEYGAYGMKIDDSMHTPM